MAACSWSPQSHRSDPSISPVKHDECTRTSMGSSFSHSPFTSARCSLDVFFSWNAISLKSPYFVGMSTLTISSINESRLRRYSIRSLIEMSLKSNFPAIFFNSGSLAMDPSSFMISTSAPAGSKPASLARSIVASVCPALRRTPPFFARNGKI